MDIRDTLITELDEARARLYDLVKDFDPVQEIYPGWKLKELLAHLTGWDDLVIAGLESVLASSPMPLSALAGVDPYNASTVSERSNLPLDLVRSEFHATRETLKSIIRRVPPERFEEVADLPWGERGNLIYMIRTFSEHEKEHYHEIVEHFSRSQM